MEHPHWKHHLQGESDPGIPQKKRPDQLPSDQDSSISDPRATPAGIRSDSVGPTYPSQHQENRNGTTKGPQRLKCYCHVRPPIMDASRTPKATTTTRHVLQDPPWTSGDKQWQVPLPSKSHNQTLTHTSLRTKGPTRPRTISRTPSSAGQLGNGTCYQSTSLKPHRWSLSVTDSPRGGSVWEEQLELPQPLTCQHHIAQSTVDTTAPCT